MSSAPVVRHPRVSRWLRALRPSLGAILFLPAWAGSVTAAPQKETSPMTPIPLLQTLAGTATPNAAWINGFPSDWLLSVRAKADGQVRGLATRVQDYAVIHPYFLRPGANELRILPAAGATVTYRVAAMDYEPGQDLGTVFADHELLRLVAPAGAATPGHREGSFQWSGVPAWHWASAPAIADDADHQASLRAAVERFWQSLDGLGGQADGSDPARRLAQGSRATMHEFIQASELGGKPFTTLDDLLRIASTRQLAGDQDPATWLAGRAALAQATPGGRSSEDDPPPHPEVVRQPNGELPPRLSLRPLGSFDGLRMALFAHGRLARLTDRSGDPVIQFVSNYSDGPRGSPNPVRFVCDPWFRLNANGQWELDAIYPTQGVRQVPLDPWPQQLLEQQPY